MRLSCYSQLLTPYKGLSGKIKKCIVVFYTHPSMLYCEYAFMADALSLKYKKKLMFQNHASVHLDHFFYFILYVYYEIKTYLMAYNESDLVEHKSGPLEIKTIMILFWVLVFNSIFLIVLM